MQYDSKCNKCNWIYGSRRKGCTSAETASTGWTLKMALIFTAGAEGFCGKGSAVNTKY